MVFASFPNRTNRVNDKARWQMISGSNFRLAGSTTAESPAFSEQLGSSGAMNRTVDPAAAEECRIGCVYDCIDIKRSDVPAGNIDLASGILHGWSSLQ
jgi:hypothetical protein